MSESEKRRRSSYKKNRKKWMRIQFIAMLVCALVLLGSLAAYYQLNKTYYIDYSESGNVEYRVKLEKNDFYEDEWQPSGEAYVSSLIEVVEAKFNYALAMEASRVNYDYSYKIDATLNVVDGNSRVTIFHPTYTIVEEQTFSQISSNTLRIGETVLIDYDTYNNLANRFIETYDLKDAKCTLTVSMHIRVTGACEDFEKDSENEYVVSLNIPLAEKTLDIKMTSTVPSGDTSILACESGINKNIFKVLTIVFACLTAALAITLTVYGYKTRNNDINYSIKVKRLVAAYKSFIQAISGEFDMSGYTVVNIKTFTEMLEIRDTIQAPILMLENEDQTCTKFFIPTNTSLLYMFEIKVDDYDEIYDED